MNNWRDCKKILCVRLDNMGDLLMTAPAITALKQTFRCSITVLTSSMAKGIAEFIPAIDEVIVYDVPWVKSDKHLQSESLYQIVNLLRSKNFDGAIVFSVFSQNPLPSVMITWLADIPRRLAYCRENPYELLTDWIPDPEPYQTIKHQVKRDLDLVKSVGALSTEEKIQIKIPHPAWSSAQRKFSDADVDLNKPWIVLHPGVSEEKRMYPQERWQEIGRQLVKLGYQVIITGSQNEFPLTENIRNEIADGAFSFAGKLSLAEFIMTIYYTPLIVSVNTSAIHIAAATETKMIVLYALTNPQHLPWKGMGKALPFSVKEELKSRNEVLRFVERTIYPQFIDLPSANIVVETALATLNDPHVSNLPEVISTN